MRLPFTQVDVFTEVPLRGNPLAVVHAADRLSDVQMQSFARWTNLSETTFLLQPTSPEADYRVRIFTPAGELPFAGHPTLGSCHAWIERGGKPRRDGRVVQECSIGLVPIRVDGQRAAFAAPPSRREEVEPDLLASVVGALGLDPTRLEAAMSLDNGPRWLTLRLASARDVLSLAPDHAALKHLPKVGVVGPHDAGRECRFEVRAFAASIGIPEDPVTGSLNASLAEWLIDEGAAPARYVAAQGTCLERAGRVYVERDGEATWIGGGSVSCITGEVSL